MRMIPVPVEDRVALGVEVKLPKTTLLAVSTDIGYIMCGALDVGLLNDKLGDRKIIAGRAVGVRTLEELIAAPLESVTHEAAARGIVPGMTGLEALKRMWD
ncbi:YunC family protein [Gorillibacterium sp. sgz5001074]|uniref:YunC family protein n=1 Tax=Gorillibacterium sp. sgz5001074 TaxID=3446695 RepID=UPI003F6619AC